jgi:hypothetical protein
LAPPKNETIKYLWRYALLQRRIVSRGRYGRTRETLLDLPEELVGKIYCTVLANFHLS